MHHMVLMATIAKCIEMTKHFDFWISLNFSIGIKCVCVCVRHLQQFSFNFLDAFQTQNPENFMVTELFSLWKCKSNIGRITLTASYCGQKTRKKTLYWAFEWVITLFFMAALEAMGVIWLVFRIFNVIWCSSVLSLL